MEISQDLHTPQVLYLQDCTSSKLCFQDNLFPPYICVVIIHNNLMAHHYYSGLRPSRPAGCQVSEIIFFLHTNTYVHTHTHNTTQTTLTKKIKIK